MEQITIVNYKFLDADPEITKYLPKFVQGTNIEMISKNLINTQVGFLDSAACKNANEPLDNNQANINIVFEKENDNEKDNKKENFAEIKENINSQNSTFTKILNWIIIAFFIIFGLLILGYSGIINWDFNIL